MSVSGLVEMRKPLNNPSLSAKKPACQAFFILSPNPASAQVLDWAFFCI